MSSRLRDDFEPTDYLFLRREPERTSRAPRITARYAATTQPS
jgi:hypothetical protein